MLKDELKAVVSAFRILNFSPSQRLPAMRPVHVNRFVPRKRVRMPSPLPAELA